MAAVKVPMICRPFMGVLPKNGVGWNWRRGLHGLPQDGSVSYLRNSVTGAEVYLVGTCHIAAKSAQLVKQVTIKKLGEASSSRQFRRSIEDAKVLQQLAGTIQIEKLLDGTIQIEELLENMTQRNFVRKLAENLTCASPEIARVFLTQRDQMMFENLRKCKGKVVAVVGMAHMDGIEQMWKDTEQNL